MTAHDPHPASDEAAPPGPVRRVAVYATLMFTVLLAIALIVVTGLRWMTQPTPSSIVVIQGDARFVGAAITVTREGEAARPPVIIEDHRDGRTPLFLENGSYLIRVEKDGVPIFRTDRPIYVAEGRRYDIDLTQPHPSTTTRP